MAMYSYDRVLSDVRQVYEQLNGVKAPRIDPRNPRFPLPKGVDPVSLVQSEINYLNLFLLNSGMSLRLSRIPAWTPNSEVFETSKEYVIDLELPGVGKDDVQVQHFNSFIIVRGARRFQRKSDDAVYLGSDRVYGTFERLYQVPPYLEPDRLRTFWNDGVLEITIPKSGAPEKTDEEEKASKRPSTGTGKA
ncbi:MAG TPA: Hsp20/alpha crystallin family protein [Blastocatellia bacterium]|jgi:HSP20 family protein|nr:Hsp20/alpha crystallin family protein [Blastocatellia bacterium]